MFLISVKKNVVVDYQKINKLGFVSKYTIFIRNCIMISLAKLVTGCMCRVFFFFFFFL